MSPQERQNPRIDGQEPQSISGGTDRLPPYAGEGNEPSDQVANDWISAADHPGEHAESDITTDDIATQVPRPRPTQRRAERMTEPLKPVDTANLDSESNIHDSDHENEGASLETFTEKEGGTPLPTSVPGDPVSPGVGPLSRGIVAIIVLVLLLILIAVIVALL